MMFKQLSFAILCSAFLALGTNAQAASENGNQQNNTQQQSSQSEQQGNSNQQAHSQQKSSQQKAQGNGKAQFLSKQKSSQVLASSIMGMSIKNKASDDADEIGTVNDLIMNKEHKLVGVVVGVGGFLGAGEKSVGIPWSEVKHINLKKGVAVVKVTEDQLDDAPSFTTKQEQQQQKQNQKNQQDQQDQQS